MYRCECWTIKKAEHQRNDVKSQLIGKDPDSGIDWGLEEKIVTEDEMVGWYHWLNEHMFEQTLGDSEGQGSHAVLHSMESQRVRHDLATEQQEETKPVGIFIQMNWILRSVWIQVQFCCQMIGFRFGQPKICHSGMWIISTWNQPRLQRVRKKVWNSPLLPERI